MTTKNTKTISQIQENNNGNSKKSTDTTRLVLNIILICIAIIILGIIIALFVLLFVNYNSSSTDHGNTRSESPIDPTKNIIPCLECILDAMKEDTTENCTTKMNNCEINKCNNILSSSIRGSNDKLPLEYLCDKKENCQSCIDTLIKECKRTNQQEAEDLLSCITQQFNIKEECKNCFSKMMMT